MALYTLLNQKQILTFTESFKIGKLLSFKGILAGTVNTYYKIKTDKGVYYLKIDETADLKRLEKELLIFKYLRQVSQQLDFQTPLPLKNSQGKYYMPFGKKFILFFPEVKGCSYVSSKLTTSHLKQMACSLATLHRASLATKLAPHRFCMPELLRVFNQIKAKLKKKHPLVFGFVQGKLSELKTNEPKKVPHALIHADLFSENVLFIGNKLNGVVDFEAAGSGPCLFDLCVGLHALCVKGKKLDTQKMTLFLKAYEKIRPLSQNEKAALPYYMEQTAMRFLLTRLRDFELKDGPVKAKPFKDYREYVRRFDEIRKLYSAKD